MSSLKTHLQKNTIRDNKALQGVFTKDCDNCAGWGSCKKSTCHKCLGSGKMPKDKITIADVIDNAESLFGKHNDWFDNYSGSEKLYYYRYCSHKILTMCIKNKPLKDIEDYIIKNLK